jgi:hypothetical protein
MLGAWRAGVRTSLRGGYGIFYSPDVINTYRQLAFQEPFGGLAGVNPVAKLHQPRLGVDQAEKE